MQIRRRGGTRVLVAGSDKRVSVLVCLIVIISTVTGRPAASAESTAAGTEDASTIIYDETYFAEHNVTTAEEILRRIPGVSAMLEANDGGGPGQAERRGFGSSGDQILINGRRLAGKSNEIGAALQRIQIQNVERIELIRGTSSDIDVRSEGVVVNIILLEGAATTNSGSATLALLLNDFGENELDGAINYNGELGNLSYFVSVVRNSLNTESRTGYMSRTLDEVYFYPTGELLQDRTTRADNSMAEYSLSANTSYEFPSGDALHLNALVKPTRINLVDVTPYREYALDGTPILTAIDLRGRSDDPKLEWELGGNYERQIGADGNLKVLWVYNHDDTSAEEYRNRVVDDDLFEVSRNLSEVLETEAIVRGSVFWPVSSAQTLETGAEIAENTLDQTIEVFFDLNGDGTAEQADIFAPSSEVTEIRSEIFANHSWSRSQRWSAATSLVYENSKITQRGIDINNSSQFDFIKPRLDIRFSPNASDQLRVRVERTVSQLDFSNFVPRYQIRQDRFSAGNPNLRPETAWEYEVGIERRLADDQGVIEARAFYNDIQDRIESVAIDLDGDGNLDPASGNIGSATEYGAEFLFAIRMTSFGLPNLIVDGRYLTRSSNVTDPFTGQKRSMAVANEYEVELGIRHDMPDRGLSYGMRYVHDGGKLIRSEWQEYRSFSRKPELDAFIELRFASRWTLRVDALGLTQNKRQRDRYVFEDGATIGTLSRSEHFHETRDRRLLLSLTARF